MSRLRLTLCPLLLVLAACATAMSGQYDLQSMNGEPLPFDEVTAVTLQLNDDGTCRVTVTTDDGIDVPDAEDSCSWTVSGGIVTVLTESDGETVTGPLNNGTMTLTADFFGDEVVAVFVRR